MLIRVVRMTFQDDKIEDFLENFEKNKKAIRSFQGCHHLELWRDENIPNVFMTYSHWENEAALDNYRNSELFKGVWAFTKTLFLERPFAFSSKKLQEVNF